MKADKRLYEEKREYGRESRAQREWAGEDIVEQRERETGSREERVEHRESEQ